MNILYLKYAVEIANTGSIKKAAEHLFMAQPNLSRAIKELENSLGITIFERTSKGMVPTANGEKFLVHAKKILAQVDEVENMFAKKNDRETFSISVPRASYIASAFTTFTRLLKPEDKTEIYYCETNALKAINNILHEDYKLAIIRYNEQDEKYFIEMLEEKGLTGELVASFKMKLACSAQSLLALSDEITLQKLDSHIEVSYGDPFVPTLSLEEAKERNRLSRSERLIYVSGRAAMFDLLAENTQTFMRCSPLSEKMLNRYNLVQKDLPLPNNKYKDFLVYKKDYHLTEFDKLFITELCNSRRKNIK